MKNLLKKLHVVQDEETSSNTAAMDEKPVLGFSGWMTSAARKNASATATDATSVSSDLLPNLESEVKDYAVEECQVQMAIELSTKEDPEAAQIEAVKQISLGSCSPHDSSPAEVLAYRYWNYNALSFDDKILDGFYDLCSVSSKSFTSKLPSLSDLKGIPLSDHTIWEAVLVNRSKDPDLSKLEQKALVIASESKSGSLGFPGKLLVQKIAITVSDYMGGAIGACNNTSEAWNCYRDNLRASVSNIVLLLGRLTVGLARHRALLFKVLADSVGIPFQILKGKQYTGSDDGAMNIVSLADRREWIVELMMNPGTLVSSDALGTQEEYDNDVFALSPFVGDCESSHIISCSSNSSSSTISSSSFESNNKKPDIATEDSSTELSYLKSKNYNKSCDHKVLLSHDMPFKPTYLLQTERITSTQLETKAKDVSQYMIDATKENPQLAQKFYDVLLESGVAVPPNLFNETCIDKQESLLSKGKKEVNADEKTNVHDNLGMPSNSLPDHNLNPKSTRSESPYVDHLKPILGLRVKTTQGEELSMQKPASPRKLIDSVLVAAAVATAAIVVSNAEGNADVPIAAAATAMAVSVVSTKSAIGMQLEQPTISNSSRTELAWSESGESSINDEKERTSDKSERSVVSVKSDALLEEVVEFGIPWEELILGERIGIGSYGEVYLGEWHGTEVAVKKLLEQDLSNDGLEEFKTEVMIMKKLRHPNVALFMGAVTRVPHLSIVTEFLPRGSLFRLIHHPNNQLNERRRLKMALDVARGMNYLHSCSPVIVHRDLKSPNLLVDKNWVVKVGDFGLSRRKQNTFLSSGSTAGTAEWMAPEVLRNEPSDEKCDVYSFGVILWELCTLQRPWGGMNSILVVGAVGFQHRRLDLPSDMDPRISEIINRCWKTDPTERPSFSEITAMLKSLQKPMNVSRSSKE